MQLTVLVDNTTNKQNLKAEAGLSFYIKDNETTILFDTGESSLFLENAELMGINVFDVNYVVLSHGHHDHSWGLNHLLQKDPYSPLRHSAPILLAHPLAFHSRIKENKELGLNIPIENLANFFTISKSALPVWLTDRIIFLGQIQRQFPYEGKHSIGHIMMENGIEDDLMYDDTALVYKSSQGLVIITGCSHSGISNIVEQAKVICKDDRIHTIIGGLHLRNPSYEQLSGTLEYLSKANVQTLYACHCTDQSSRIFLAQLGNLKEVTVGLTLEFPT
ncbi:MBL fold metallo-hydrolase [bacterium BFN5]|nr:MBL fold metallo-hydrolase [bacterium BFN5]QJW45519.1 MBL fold metallo-hydrolase [bacterium BFN5]